MVRPRQRRTGRELRSLSRQTEELSSSQGKPDPHEQAAREPATRGVLTQLLFPDKDPDDNQNHDYDNRANRPSVHWGNSSGVNRRTLGLYTATRRKCKQFRSRKWAV